MKRSEKRNPADTRLRWKKIGGGCHYHSDGQKVKKGEILLAHPDEMSKIIKAGFTCLDKIDPGEHDFGSQLLIQKSKIRGRYNVINPATMEPINDTPISKKAAESFGPIED